MLIYGTRTALIDRKTTNVSCPYCHSAGTVTVHVFRKYAHLFWIPFFPLRKKSVSECSHCRQVLEKKEMPQPLARIAKEAQDSSRTPVWLFAGLSLLATFLLFLSWNSERLAENTAAYLESPQPGDVYELKQPAGYTLWRVAAVSGDTVFVRESLFFTDRPRGLRKLKKQDGSTYIPHKSAKPKALLLELFRKGELLNAERP